MDFDFSEEEQAISGLTRQILEDKVTHEHLRAMSTSGESFDRNVWQSLAETGVIGASISEEYGGANLGFLSVTVVLELVGEFAAPIPVLEAIIMGAMPIARFGTDEQKSNILPKVASGECILTAALVPGSTVTVTDNKLSGSVDFVPYGLESDLVLVPTDDESATSRCLVATLHATFQLRSLRNSSSAVTSARFLLTQGISITLVPSVRQFSLDQIRASSIDRSTRAEEHNVTRSRFS